jgi:hypothetical protein
VLFVCCLIVVPLPPGENPFAVNNNNNNNHKPFCAPLSHFNSPQEKEEIDFWDQSVVDTFDDEEFHLPGCGAM